MSSDKNLPKDKRVFDLNKTPIYSQKDKLKDKIMTQI